MRAWPNETTAMKVCKSHPSDPFRIYDIKLMQQKIETHDLDMLKVTRTLQSQIDEKERTIEQYKLVLKQEKEKAKEDKKRIKENFETSKKNEDQNRDNTLDEQRRDIQKMSEQEEDINFYYNNYEEKQAEIKNEENRFKMLLRQLAEVEAQGAEDIERQKQRINNQYFKNLEDFQKDAQSKAERNISEIERNIQI